MRFQRGPREILDLSNREGEREVVSLSCSNRGINKIASKALARLNNFTGHARRDLV